MKATKQYFHVVLFIMLYKVLLTFESVTKSLSVTIENYRATLSCGAVYSPVNGGWFLLLTKII